jgi:hypothetical protein
MSDHDAPTRPDEPAEVAINETTVGLVDGQRVGVGNLWAADYELPDGTTAHAMTAQLFLLGESRVVIVGPGSRVEIGGRSWQVVAVDKPDEHRHGLVRLAPA